MVTRIRGVTHAMQRLHFARFQRPTDSWQPAINVYLCADKLDVCVDLAGVSVENVSIEVAERQLRVSGHRPSPEEAASAGLSKCRQIIAMEIESGDFNRVLDLPVDVDAEAVRAEHDQGLLWVRLPIRAR
jgi:HSP20 family protein